MVAKRDKGSNGDITIPISLSSRRDDSHIDLPFESMTAQEPLLPLDAPKPAPICTLMNLNVLVKTYYWDVLSLSVIGLIAIFGTINSLSIDGKSV
jgi:hypothetical protein